MKKLHIILLTAATLLSLGASAQSFRSGYFLDNYTYGYRINPAQVNDKGFFAIGVGNIDLQNCTNLGISSFLFPKENGTGLVTGLNKSVSAETFLGGLKQNNFISLDENINILSFGIANGRRMHTVELNLRVPVTLNLPYDIFSFAKTGGNRDYNISGIYVDVTALADLSYGYSMYIMDGLSVGGRLHFLAGAANVNLSGQNTKISLSESKISVSPNLDLVTSGILGIEANSTGDGIDPSKIGINTSTPIGGFGATIDLGVEYKTNFGLDAMISITDLGFISWKNDFAANASGSFEYTGTTIGFEGGTIKTDLADLMDISKILSFKAGKGTSSATMMPFDIAAGARYFMPFYDKLSVGLLATYHNAKYASWFDTRFGATITPARILSLSGNIGYGSFGATWGTGLNLHLGPVNLLVGADCFLGKMGRISKITVPIEPAQLNLHAGLCFTF